MVSGVINLNNKNYVASVFRTFDLGVSTLSERIAFQKTIYLLQKLGSGTDFNFIWHNFGPYSREVSQLGFSLNESDKINAPIMNGLTFEKFVKLKEGYKRDSRFLEMISDIIYLRENNKISDEKELFINLVSHQSYLNDETLFNVCLQKLRRFNFI